MKAAIFSFVSVHKNSMVASVRIVRYLQEKLQIPLFTSAEIGEQNDLDLLIIVNGAFAFCKVLPELAIAIIGAKRLVWVQNDYTIVPPAASSGAESPFRKAFVLRHDAGKPHIDYWSTVQQNAEKPGSSYVNWNVLTWAPQPQTLADHTDQLLYYGSYRNNREVYFDRYFTRPGGLVYISSPSAKFQSRYTAQQVQHAGPLQLGAALGGYGLGLYVEDKRSHKEFHSPANRFYEMLGARLPMVFAPECGSMLRKAGIDPTPYSAANWREINALLERRDAIGAEQWERWGGIDYSTQLSAQLNAAWTKAK